MNTTLETLGRQHREVLARLDDVDLQLHCFDAQADLSGFVAYLEHEVCEHFTVEERALFPALARYLSLVQGPLAVMNVEHLTFREMLQRLAAAVHAGNWHEQRERAQAIIDLLRDHIAKEDHVLFPMAERLLGPEEEREVDALAAELGAAERGTVPLRA